MCNHAPKKKFSDTQTEWMWMATSASKTVNFTQSLFLVLQVQTLKNVKAWKENTRSLQTDQTYIWCLCESMQRRCSVSRTGRQLQRVCSLTGSWEIMGLCSPSAMRSTALRPEHRGHFSNRRNHFPRAYSTLSRHNSIYI